MRRERTSPAATADAITVSVLSHTATDVPNPAGLSNRGKIFCANVQDHVVLLVAVYTNTAPAPGPASLSNGAPTAARLLFAATERPNPDDDTSKAAKSSCPAQERGDTAAQVREGRPRGAPDGRVCPLLFEQGAPAPRRPAPAPTRPPNHQCVTY